MPEQLTRKEALERVLRMAQCAPSGDIKQECLRRAEEIASGMDGDTVASIKARVKATLQ